jgi:hypothetical protein
MLDVDVVGARPRRLLGYVGRALARVDGQAAVHEQPGQQDDRYGEQHGEQRDRAPVARAALRPVPGAGLAVAPGPPHAHGTPPGSVPR